MSRMCNGTYESSVCRAVKWREILELSGEVKVMKQSALDQYLLCLGGGGGLSPTRVMGATGQNTKHLPTHILLSTSD